jgi:hypothetical protein
VVIILVQVYSLPHPSLSHVSFHLLQTMV